MPPSPDPIQPYRRVQAKGERDVSAILESTAKAIQKRILRLGRGVGADVRRSQLTLTLRAIRKMQRAAWVGGVVPAVARGIDDAEKAAETAIETMTRVAYAGLPEAVAQTLVDGLRAAAESGLKSDKARRKRELSDRVYRQAALHEGKVEEAIRQGIIANLSAKELADTVYDYVSPSAKGGASYAAMRLARTEINNAFHERQLQGATRPGVSAVKWNLSGSHKVPDMCNVYAVHGGNGEWKPEAVPEKPHPQCFCFLTYVTLSSDDFLKKLEDGGFDDELDRRMKRNMALLGQSVGDTVAPQEQAEKKTARRKTPAVGSVATMTDDQSVALSSDNSSIRQRASNNLYDEFAYGSKWFNKKERGIDRKPAIREYFGNSTRINTALRKGKIDAEVQAIIDEMDSAMKLTKLKSPLVVFRGVSGAIIQDAAEGDIITDPIYWSTAVDPQQAKKFARSEGSVLMHIELPEGTNCIAENATETEVLLPRNTSVQITRVEGDNVFAVLVPTD